MVSTATLESPQFARIPPNRVPAAPDRRPGAPVIPAKPPRAWGLFVVAAVGYCALGLLLSLRYGFHNEDAISRTANASYVLFSRYPHLAAVGFVWNPLPSLAQLPILIFRPWWPALQTQALAGPLMSGMFMAGAVVQVFKIVHGRGASRVWVWGLTAAFALNPLVLLLAANGLSEAPYLFFTTWAVYRLMRWLDTDEVADLIVAGVALGLDFLARYETVAIAAAAAVLVIFVTFSRAKTDSRWRALSLGLVDACLVTLPFVLSFVGWAVVGWIITGNAFSQFSSVYGNSSQVAVGMTGVTRSVLPSVSEVMGHVLLMQVLLPAAVVVALALSVRRRDMGYLPALLLYGGGLAFVALSYVSGTTIGNLRYYSLEVPLMIVSLAIIPAVDTARPHLAGFTEPPPPSAPRRSWIIRFGGGLFAVVVILGSVPLMVRSVQNPSEDLSDSNIRSVLHSAKYPMITSDQSQLVPYGRQISDYVASLNLRHGSVLVDTWQGFPIVVTSINMKTYVISSDLDFTACLNDPVRFGVQYFIVPSPTGVGVLDAINRRYPTFWRTGAGFAHLVITFRSSISTFPAFRLYRIDPPASSSAVHR